MKSKSTHSDTSHRARRRFGQNFLQDEQVIHRIASAVNNHPTLPLVEIGPGRGALTAALLESREQLQAVELDRDLIEPLQQRFGDRLTLLQADALTVDFCRFTEGQPLRIIGNLPYNISTPLLFHLLEHATCIYDMHFMLQQEVVARLAATPGSSAWGRLSVMVQYRCRVEPLLSVPPEAFYPIPKVWSAVVRLTPLPQPAVAVTDPERFAALVTAAFSQRRKTLRNTLRQWFEADAIRALGIDPGRRPETLTLAEFATLSNGALP